ncbi:MAG TPA: hypothetical protein VH092_20865 [Urbifossiella sp.]|jgi:hypothetical protein|nr:hypothetical protein [Urbifossiella sp.]
MARTIRGVLVAAVLAGLFVSGAGADEPKGGKAGPPGTPLAVTITGKAKYAFDPGSLSPEAYRKTIEDAARPDKKLPFGTKLPVPPEVDLVVELKNTSDRPVTMWANGDPVVLTLTLSGKGAYNLDPPIAMTREFRIPQEIKLDAGKTHALPVKMLKSGTRGVTHYGYWTGPGEYELTATLKTGVSPAPKGAQVNDGFGVVTLTSAPFKLSVEGK